MNLSITQNHNMQDISFNLLNNFYFDAHTCPHCGKNMYKTVFPVGNEYPIYSTSVGQVYLKRAFTCSMCLSILLHYQVKY